MTPRETCAHVLYLGTNLLVLEEFFGGGGVEIAEMGGVDDVDVGAKGVLRTL